METKGIIRAIRKSPVSERMLIVESTLKTIRESELSRSIISASESLFEDYKNDKEFTAFTQIDFEGF